MSYRKLFILIVCVCSPNIINATVTLHFNDAFTTGLPNNLANGSGTVTNGMRWGVVISTTDGSFAGGGSTYDAYTTGSGTAGYLSYNGSLTDDYFIPGTLTQDGSALGVGADGGTTAGGGSILDDLIVPFGSNGISSTDIFSLIWFGSAGNTATAGSKYGFFTDASFVVGSDGGDPVFGSVFAGNDPIRTASNTFQAVPEPSRILFLGLGSLGFLMRRRRA